MPTFRLCITQVCRVERRIIILRDAATAGDAIEAQHEADAPHYDDPNWVEHPDLQHESVKQASNNDEDEMRRAKSVAIVWPPKVEAA